MADVKNMNENPIKIVTINEPPRTEGKILQESVKYKQGTFALNVDILYVLNCYALIKESALTD